MWDDAPQALACWSCAIIERCPSSLAACVVIDQRRATFSPHHSTLLHRTSSTPFSVDVVTWIGGRAAVRACPSCIGEGCKAPGIPPSSCLLACSLPPHPCHPAIFLLPRPRSMNALGSSWAALTRRQAPIQEQSRSLPEPTSTYAGRVRPDHHRTLRHWCSTAWSMRGMAGQCQASAPAGNNPRDVQ